MGPGSAEALKLLYDTLQRYAGWLDRERTSVMVRADVEALGAAIHTGADPWPLVHALDTNIARLPSGEPEAAARRRESDASRDRGVAMNTTEVDTLVRSVIVHLGLPFAVLSVFESPAGWNIESAPAPEAWSALRSLAAGRWQCVAIQEKLEATLERNS
jgi:hypothetical protein